MARSNSRALLGLVAVAFAFPCCLSFEQEASLDACEASTSDDDSCMLQKHHAPSSRAPRKRSGELEEVAKPPQGTSSLQVLQESRKCNSTGGRAWLSKKGLENVAHDVIVPILVGRLMGLGLVPKTAEMTGFKIVLQNFKFKKLTLDPIALNLVAGEGLRVYLSGLAVDLDVDYMAEGSDWWNPLWSSGAIHAKVSETSAAMGSLKVDVTPDGYPDVTLDIDKLDLQVADLEMSGSVFSGLLNIMVSLFEETVEGMVAERIKEGLEEYVSEDLLTLIRESLPLAIPLLFPPPYNTTEADLSLCAVNFAQDHVEIDVRGVVQDTADPGFLYPALPLLLDEDPPEDLLQYDVALSLGQWVVNGFLWHIQHRGLLEHTIYQADVPEDSPVELNTNALNPLFPAFWIHRLWHGRTLPLRVILHSTRMPNITLSDGHLNLHAEVEMALEVIGAPKDKTVALAVRVPLAASVSLGIDDSSPQRLRTKVKYVSATPIQLLSSIVPLHKELAMHWLIEGIASHILTPIINKGLAKGIELSGFEPVTLGSTSLAITERVLWATSNLDVNITRFVLENYGAYAAENALKALQ